MTVQTIVVAAATGNELKSGCAGFANTGIPDQGQWKRVDVRGRKLFLLNTGIGPINAAEALGRLLGAEHDVSGVVNIGVAGSFDLARHPLASTALVNREIWPEFGLKTETGIDPQGIGFSMGRIGGRPVFERLDLDPRSAALKLHLELQPAWPEAASLTVAGVTGSSKRAERLSQLGAVLENMEGFALAWTCLRNHIQFLEVRTISNSVGSREPKDWSLKPALNALADVCRTLFTLDRSKDMAPR